MTTGKLSKQLGSEAISEISGRFGGRIVSLAALTAIPARNRENGMVVVVMPADAGIPELWTWDYACDVTADALRYLEADDSSTGRWRRSGSNPTTFVLAGQNETSDATITATGIGASDEIISFLVFDTGVPTVRALADFTVAANVITVVDNDVDNSGNYYVVTYNRRG